MAAGFREALPHGTEGLKILETNFCNLGFDVRHYYHYSAKELGKNSFNILLD
jgi:predicted glycosyltransferase involved in capsule biosynthesis